MSAGPISRGGSKRVKPEVVAKKRSSHAKTATAVPVPDRHMICPGSGIHHPQVFLRVFQGQSIKFIRCPIPECRVNLFFNGTGWEVKDFGVTRAQIIEMNPGALVL